MREYQIGMCGLDCQECEWRVSHNCGGCKETQGKPFYGDCRLAVCVKSKQVEDCSYCPDLPCALLTEFAYDEEHGDAGERIRVLEAARDSRR
jgi:hypothetical protein